MVNTRTDAELAAAVQAAVDAMLPQIREQNVVVIQLCYEDCVSFLSLVEPSVTNLDILDEVVGRITSPFALVPDIMQMVLNQAGKDKTEHGIDQDGIL
ncbi:hypothetical protein Tco_0594046 [Tanacetum coccineum]